MLYASFINVLIYYHSDDVPFDKYVQRLSQAGTFAGNDVIVAFARLHTVSVVIHQLNSPAWVIHPSKDSQEQGGVLSGNREVHIFYHNCNHYNSGQLFFYIDCYRVNGCFNDFYFSKAYWG
jgi:hypothetical protein